MARRWHISNFGQILGAATYNRCVAEKAKKF